MVFRVFASSSSLSMAERRRLRWQAMEMTRGSASACGRDLDPPIKNEAGTFFETVLAHIGQLSAQTKVDVVLAKRLLRGFGADGAKLASRLGRLSQLRNRWAHPDVALLSDLDALWAGRHEREQGLRANYGDEVDLLVRDLFVDGAAQGHESADSIASLLRLEANFVQSLRSDQAADPGADAAAGGEVVMAVRAAGAILDAKCGIEEQDMKANAVGGGSGGNSLAGMSQLRNQQKAKPKPKRDANEEKNERSDVELNTKKNSDEAIARAVALLAMSQDALAAAGNQWTSTDSWV